MQFYNKDENKLVQIGAHRLSINILKPYDGWESFKPRIEECLKIYKELSNPTGYSRRGLRYINRVDIPEPRHESEVISIKDYFLFVPQTPQGLPIGVSSFNMRVEFPYDGGVNRLGVFLGSVKKHIERYMYAILDFDYYVQSENKMELAELDWIDRAHQRIEEAFEKTITDKSRNLFEVVE